MIVFDQGPWIIGKVKGTPAGAMTMWKSAFSPGPILGGRPALDVQPSDSLRYHPYKISRESTLQDPDVVDWPNDLGAPTDPLGKPLLLGDELIWSVFNGADTTLRPKYWTQGRFEHLPIEVRQSVYGRKAESPTDTSLLANTAFIEWMIINKGPDTIDSCYMGLWADVDFDNTSYNYPAIDTTLGLAYCWNSNPSPLQPYAVGYAMLYGPSVPDSTRSAIFQGRTRPGYRNLDLSSFYGITFDGGPDTLFTAAPTNIKAAWNIARGVDKIGNPIIDPVSKITTRFLYNGDPVTGHGWIYGGPNKGSEGFLMFTGPFSLTTNDTQWMMAALIPVDAANRFASIQLLRQKTGRLLSMPYQWIANPGPLSGISTAPTSPETPVLFQSYPNPFNPTSTIRYGLPTRIKVVISVYNTLGQEVCILVDEEAGAGYHEVRFDARRLASGIYFYRLRAGTHVETKKLILLR